MDYFSYNSNPNLKRVGSKINFTQHEIDELIKCKSDPIYFVKNYCKIVSLDSEEPVPFSLFGYQEKFISLLHNNRRIISMQPRQMGKTQTVAAYICWYITFQANQTVAILANKGDASREILSRCKFMYEYLPKWMQHGISKWNEGSIALENGSKVFCSATTKSGLRGRSCVTGDTKVCVLNNEDIYYIEISDLINKSNFIDIEKGMEYKYIVYKITNKINGMFYVGFHKTKNINDGYLGSGKYIKRAIEKYGPENFSKEILHVFDTKEEAEAKEAEIVDKDFTLREDTYNINVGGNVRISFGTNNAWFGKKHSQETLDRIQKTRKENGLPTYQTSIKHLKTGEIYYGYKKALEGLGFIKDENFDFVYKMTQERIFLAQKISENVITIENKDIEERLLKAYNEHLHMIKTEVERKEKFSKDCSVRRKGKTQTKEHAKKRGESIKKWIENNPEEHQEKMAKINKDPEKRRKTAEKNRGSKRTDEQKKNISLSLIGKSSKYKGAKACHCIETGEVRLIKDGVLPEGFILGYPKRIPRTSKLYNNGLEQKFFEVTEVPEGWSKGGLPKPRKS